MNKESNIDILYHQRPTHLPVPEEVSRKRGISMERGKTVCFSGDNSDHFSRIILKGPEAFYALRERTAQAIVEAVDAEADSFMFGLARGFDLVAANVLLELRANRLEMADLKVVAVLPFEGHGFSDPWQVLHALVLAEADEVLTLSRHYHPEARRDCGRYMVDHSGRLICHCESRRIDRDCTAGYAREQGLTIINLRDSTPSRSLGGG